MAKKIASKQAFTFAEAQKTQQPKQAQQAHFFTDQPQAGCLVHLLASREYHIRHLMVNGTARDHKAEQTFRQWMQAV